MKKIVAFVSAALLLAACADKPKTPDWQMEAHGAIERFVPAYMEGNARVEQAEFDRARRETGSTGRIDLVARVELTRCAARVAALVVEPCAGFEALRRDAAPAERAYADYLAARVSPADAALLPPAQRAVASGTGDAGAVKAIADPFSRLVAASVLFQSGRASPDVIATAVDTSSAQGWRRPLLAWLGVQVQRADAAGAKNEAERIRRRIALVLNER